MMLWARCSFFFLEEVMWEYESSFQGVFRALSPSVGCVGGPVQMLDGDEVGCSSSAADSHSSVLSCVDGTWHHDRPTGCSLVLSVSGMSRKHSVGREGSVFFLSASCSGLAAPYWQNCLFL